jgi:hypothetical protein
MPVQTGGFAGGEIAFDEDGFLGELGRSEISVEIRWGRSSLLGADGEDQDGCECGAEQEGFHGVSGKKMVTREDLEAEPSQGEPSPADQKAQDPSAEPPHEGTQFKGTQEGGVKPPPQRIATAAGQGRWRADKIRIC